MLSTGIFSDDTGSNFFGVYQRIKTADFLFHDPCIYTYAFHCFFAIETPSSNEPFLSEFW